ncbi:hypothetical protein MIZ01_0597 [Sideroxyarcus emersonii]|uniref:Uncharacterized protein n=1 Tax=Sideroxyarcus emersonii TaxID=2764705 RepID=A0AAN1X8D7_9PROT|nr:hypothetical protein MIZ01_0597 [Sideroxyarcus emersonii]
MRFVLMAGLAAYSTCLIVKSMNKSDQRRQESVVLG